MVIINMNPLRDNKFKEEFWQNYISAGEKMEDKQLLCKDCGKEFTFTAGEQEFYKEKGFENDPVRCPECRRQRKNSRNNSNFGGSRPVK
jgi:DNA-directed RNA polymerase subunit RPC12/RpoP